jgi:hypothetical protein
VRDDGRLQIPGLSVEFRIRTGLQHGVELKNDDIGFGTVVVWNVVAWKLKLRVLFCDRSKCGKNDLFLGRVMNEESGPKVRERAAALVERYRSREVAQHSCNDVVIVSQDIERRVRVHRELNRMNGH